MIDENPIMNQLCAYLNSGNPDDSLKLELSLNDQIEKYFENVSENFINGDLLLK